jgi:hypothetical protein
MEEWEKSDVFQSLNKLLTKEFPSLFRNDGFVINGSHDDDGDDDLSLVFCLPVDQNCDFHAQLNLILGPFQITFSLKMDITSADILISDRDRF